MTKHTHGGARPNAGRKPKEEKTKVISIRVPELKAIELKKEIHKLIKNTL